MTPKQRARQGRDHRNHGQYAKVNPCYRCGKSAGVDYLSANGRTDCDDSLGNSYGDQALCLCPKCCTYFDELIDQVAWAEVNDPRWGTMPQGKEPNPAAHCTCGPGNPEDCPKHGA